MKEQNEFIEKYKNRLVRDFSGRVVKEAFVKKMFDYWKQDAKNSEQIIAWLHALENKIINRLDVGKQKFSTLEIEDLIENCIYTESREYDMSHIVDIDSIKDVKAIKLENQVSYNYDNITITPLGSLRYTEDNGIENFSGVTYYKIQRQLENGKKETYGVFSNIDNLLMETDMDYKEAVMEKLLDDRNIRRSNCGGYIGTIKSSKVDSTIKANKKYSLVFDEKDASAVMKLAAQQEKENEGEIR